MKEKKLENTDAVEVHGCIVCGKVYNMLVIYGPDGKLIDCAVTSPGGRVVRDIDRPLVACKKHKESEIEAALIQHYPGRVVEESEDD